MNQADMHQQRGLTRRQFLTIGWTVAGLIAAGEAAGAIGLFLQPRIREVFGGTVTLGRVDDLKQRLPVGGVPIYFPEARLFLARTQDGFLVMSFRCTHLNQIVDWKESGDQFHCRVHGGLYDRKGEVLGGPPPRPLDLFNMRVEHSYLIVDTSKPIQRKAYQPSQALKA